MTTVAPASSVSEPLLVGSGYDAPNTYTDGNCPLARTLEVVGERWTLMIIRDAFYGVRRFGDFATQLGIPRAVLTNRLKSLTQEGVLTREDDGAGVVEYRLTDKGLALWPVVRALMNWGGLLLPAGIKRLLRHDVDGESLTGTAGARSAVR